MCLPVLSLCLSTLEQRASLQHGLWLGLGCLQAVVGLQVTSGMAWDNTFAGLMFSFPRDQGLVCSSPTPRASPVTCTRASVRSVLMASCSLA